MGERPEGKIQLGRARRTQKDSTLEKWGGMVWTGCISVRITGTSGGILRG
jgi:hypothetical protein